MTQTEILLGLVLALTVSAVWQMLQGIRGLKQRPPEYARAIGRRMILTTVVMIAIPLLIMLGRDQWGNMTSLYAVLAGLVTVNVIWVRRIR
ncbi:MAG: hypothetical protein QMB72_00110 [Brachymonas denitrificans]|jgi:hypothetical protein|uniref:hypothetical protein n=1 Tax=Brachymonas denitrificans TaxID=28220 RepID=UPI001BCE5627|nr:hypothetical protein [Brachymonas denitrificans]